MGIKTSIWSYDSEGSTRMRRTPAVRSPARAALRTTGSDGHRLAQFFRVSGGWEQRLSGAMADLVSSSRGDNGSSAGGASDHALPVRRRATQVDLGGRRSVSGGSHRRDTEQSMPCGGRAHGRARRGAPTCVGSRRVKPPRRDRSRRPTRASRRASGCSATTIQPRCVPPAVLPTAHAEEHRTWTPRCACGTRRFLQEYGYRAPSHSAGPSRGFSLKCR